MLVKRRQRRMRLPRCAEPRGVVKVDVSITLLHVHGRANAARFMARYPDVSVQLEATNRRRVDVVGEGLDVAIASGPDHLRIATGDACAGGQGHRLPARS